jgi:hypothetical protein
MNAKAQAIKDYITKYRAILNKMFGKPKPAETVKITRANISSWPKLEKLFNDGQIKSDSLGQLRYLHGAPVGDMILVRIDKDGMPVYKESAEKWFDPGSQSAKDFVWR